MLHPIFKTVLGHPELIANHLACYLGLIKEEATDAGRSLAARLISGLFAIVSALLALTLCGVAVMLGVLHGSFNWVLVIVPGLAALLAVVCALIARGPAETATFANLREQFHADLSALNSVKDQNHDR